SSIAWKELGVPITNTTMLVALIKCTNAVALESVKGPLDHRFGRVANKNLAAMKRAYDEVKFN
ncbi:MAG: pyruvate synthase, partial [Deltaproteobacteria bacterium]